MGHKDRQVQFRRRRWNTNADTDCEADSDTTTSPNTASKTLIPRIGESVKLTRARVALLLLAMSSAFLPMQMPAEPQSGIEGVITISPWHPGPVRSDEPASKPLANATFVVQTEANAVASEFTTDARGGFRVSLPPGHYKVSLKGKKGGVGKYGPFEVHVAADKMTTVHWTCDTGMR